MDKSPDLGRGQVGVTETIVVGELSRMGRATAPVEICRCADDKSPNLAEPPRDHAGIRQSGDPQRHVEPAADEVENFVAEMEIDRYFRVCRNSGRIGAT
jgi:hypothetical protein